MMLTKNTSNKRQSNQKGITMIYALLAIALLTMVGVVIFNAASANYARLKNEKANQQAYLTVSSAAKVFVDGIVGDKVTYNVVEEISSGVVTKSTISDWKYVPSGLANPSPVQRPLLSFVREYGEAQYYGTEISKEFSNKYEISASFADNKELDRVYVDMKMDKYDIIAVFSNWDQKSAEPEYVYYVTVRIPFVREEGNYKPVKEKESTIYDEDGNPKTVTTTYKIEWDAGNVSITRGKE